MEIQSTPISRDIDAERFLPTDRGIVPDPSLREAFTAQGKGTENLDRLFGGDALCVTTGQQPGLFTGPLFTVYKAVSAIVLARACAAKLDRPVVPVFWVAGDDHDFAEANHTHLLGPDHEVTRLSLAPREADAPSTPLYREVLGSEVDALIARVGELTPETEFRDDVMRWLAAHYRPGTDMATAFSGSLGELLGPAGLIMFNPTHVRAKSVAAPWIMQALEVADELDRELTLRAEELTAAGHATPVSVAPRNTLVMLDGARGRDRLVIADGGFKTRRSGEYFSLDQLREMATEAPERLSGNVLLRPVVEAALLPTVAYIGGPGELDYFPQTSPVYRALKVPPQMAVPRWSARVIESRVRRTLERYGLEPADFQAGEGQLEGRLVRESMPDEVTGAIARLRDAVETEFQGLVRAAKTIDDTLGKPVESAGNQMVKGIAHVEKRIMARVKQQQETLVRQIAGGRNAILPNGHPQERVINILQFLVRYGPGFLADIERACDEWARGLEPTSQSS